MKTIIVFLILLLTSVAASAQNADAAQIRQKMAEIRRNTNWDDPAAAKKANEEIQSLAQQLNGGKTPLSFSGNQQQPAADKPLNISLSAVTRENVITIAERYFDRSYKNLDQASKLQFEEDYKNAGREDFSLKSVRRLTSTGGILIALSDNSDLACVYLSTAVKIMADDTLSLNNFGGFLRLIDSVKTSIPVLLYANSIFSESPVILTQLGNSMFELGDYSKAETYYKEALKNNPDFGQAHSSLCDLYILQGRYKEAIIELFAGVKTMGCSYMHGSNNFALLRQESERSDQQQHESGSKEEFWNETKRQLSPSESLAPLVPVVEKVKIPEFPSCKSVEDWLEGGGFSSAVNSFQAFQSYLGSFIEEFQEIHSQSPAIPTGAILRDYSNERLALDCITEMFFNQAHNDEEAYRKEVDQIIQQVNDAKEEYLRNLERITAKYLGCCEKCGDNGECLIECQRLYCSEECPNANRFNEFLGRAYTDYLSLFNRFVIRQRKILDDLYGFSMPWFNKLNSPYWSQIYAYEIKRVALSIAGNCYGAYPQPFQMLAHNTCGADCSVYAKPFFEKPEEVNKSNPTGNNCPPHSKEQIPLGVCSISWDCESYELGCSAGVSGSIKRNTVKKTTTIFLGAGLEGGIVAKAGGTFGGQLTIGDDGSFDGGLKATVSGTSGAPLEKGAPTGVEQAYTVTIMGGVKSETTKVYNPLFR